MLNLLFSALNLFLNIKMENYAYHKISMKNCFDNVQYDRKNIF